MSVWDIKSEQLNETTIRYQILHGNRPLSVNQVIKLWQDSDEFVQFYNDILTDCPFEAFFWEHPAIGTSHAGDAYEFILMDAPQLAKARPDAAAFAVYFKDAVDQDRTVTGFLNLGGDAFLVSPLPGSTADGKSVLYTHLGTFVRQAPATQMRQFWKDVGLAVTRQLKSKPELPLWLSTSGLGVYWLHVRLDAEPKYYQHDKYRFGSSVT